MTKKLDELYHAMRQLALRNFETEWVPFGDRFSDVDDFMCRFR